MKKEIVAIIKKIKKDPSLIFILVMPLLLNLVLLFTSSLIPSILAYKKVFDVSIVLSVSFVCALVGSLINLDTKKESISKNNIVFASLSIIYTIILMSVIPFQSYTIRPILLMSLSNGFMEILLQTLSSSFAHTKEGIFKVSSLITIFWLAAVLPLVNWWGVQFKLAFIPSFWMGRYLDAKMVIIPFWSIMVSSIWLLVIRIIKFSFVKKD